VFFVSEERSAAEPRVPGNYPLCTGVVPQESTGAVPSLAAHPIRLLYDAGVYVNVALHPAVPPGGALLRTSVMATHDRATLDRALSAFGDVKRAFEGEHGPLPGPDAQPPAQPAE